MTSSSSTSSSADFSPGEGPLGALGPNEWLVEEMYQQYRRDPASVDPAWGHFFHDYGNGAKTDNGTATGNGAKTDNGSSAAAPSPSRPSPPADGENPQVPSPDARTAAPDEPIETPPAAPSWTRGLESTPLPMVRGAPGWWRPTAPPGRPRRLARRRPTPDPPPGLTDPRR